MASQYYSYTSNFNKSAVTVITYL